MTRGYDTMRQSMAGTTTAFIIPINFSHLLDSLMTVCLINSITVDDPSLWRHAIA